MNETAAALRAKLLRPCTRFHPIAPTLEIHLAKARAGGGAEFRPICIEVRLQLIFGRRALRGDVLVQEFHLLAQTPPDDQIVLLQAQRKRLAVEDLLPDVAVDESRKLRARRRAQPRALELVREAFYLDHEDITPEHLRHFWVIKEKGEILGTVGLEILGSSALLRSLAVDPRFRKRGFASELARKAEDYAASIKIEKVFLLTMTAEGFFLKRGYQKIERISAPPEIQGTTEFQGLCPVSSVCMVKKLA